MVNFIYSASAFEQIPCILCRYPPVYSLKVNTTRIIVLYLGFSVLKKHMRSCQIPFVPRHTFTYHMEEITATLWCIYRNELVVPTEPSGWKGSVTYGLGADISLPHCLATGIWTSAPKTITGPKSRGTSFGTTLWRHVQRYCAQIHRFMQITCSGRSFLIRRKFPWINLFDPFEKCKVTILVPFVFFGAF